MDLLLVDVMNPFFLSGGCGGFVQMFCEYILLIYFLWIWYIYSLDLVLMDVVDILC